MKFSSNASLFLSCIFFLACGTTTSDAQQVRAAIASIEAAAENRDSSDVLAQVSDAYADSQDWDKAQLQNFLRGYFLLHPKLELLVKVESLVFPADGLAQAEISVASVGLDPQLLYLKVEFRRHDKVWLVTRADRASR